MRYWIQEQAPDGGFFDSVGLDASTDLESAKAQARSWAKSFPNRIVRLIIRNDTVIEYCGGAK